MLMKPHYLLILFFFIALQVVQAQVSDQAKGADGPGRTRARRRHRAASLGWCRR